MAQRLASLLLRHTMYTPQTMIPEAKRDDIRGDVPSSSTRSTATTTGEFNGCDIDSLNVVA